MKCAFFTSALVWALPLLAHEETTLPEGAVDTNSIPWALVPIPELNHKLPVKPLFEDSETGASATKIKYQAGFTNTWHTHTTGHGMYVLDGVLNTHKGQFTPGQFVWFPAGEKMYHGATNDNDVIFIFITSKAFDIEYLKE